MKHVSDDLAPYVEGLLHQAQVSRVATHLLACRRCRRELDQVRAGHRLAQTLATPASGVPTWSQIAGCLEAPAAYRPAIWRITFAAAAVVALVGGAWLRQAPSVSAAQPQAVAAYFGQNGAHACTDCHARL